MGVGSLVERKWEQEAAKSRDYVRIETKRGVTAVFCLGMVIGRRRRSIVGRGCSERDERGNESVNTHFPIYIVLVKRARM